MQPSTSKATPAPASTPSTVPPSRASSVSGAAGENKSARKRRKKQSRESSLTPQTVRSIKKDRHTPPEAGPSSIPDTQEKDKFGDDDFIAFEEEEEETGVVEATSPREADKGKEKVRDDEEGHVGRKRKVGEVDLDDGYTNKKQRLDAASRRAPWARHVDWDSCQNVSQMLHREVEAFVKYISPTPVEDEVRSLIVQLVSKAVKESFPDAVVLPFGSYQTKLYLPLGDIDLVIMSKSMAYSRIQSVLHALANTVKRAGLTDKVTIIGKAKVPIVKFITRHGRFSVDISVNRENGITAGKIITSFLDEIPALRALVLIIKSFLSQRSMNEVFTGGLGSYSIVCLATSFLQMHPKIRRGEIDPMKNLGVLVMEFFELYGFYFNYSEVGISLRDGGSYYNKRHRGWLDYRSPGLLSIEDPGDPSNDISKGSYGIAKVRQTLAGAFGIMTSAAFIHAEYINARRERRSVRLREDRRTTEEMSILASVMGVTQETINHRKVVQEVYDSGVLHRMLGLEFKVPVQKDPPSTARKPTSKQTHEAQESVKSAWKGSDVDPEDDKYEVHSPLAPDEDEGRYGIVDQPARKRRRTGTKKDLHTVYTASDDEGEFVKDDGLSDEESEYNVDLSDGHVSGEGFGEGKRHRTRSYWLSKGVPLSLDDD